MPLPCGFCAVIRKNPFALSLRLFFPIACLIQHLFSEKRQSMGRAWAGFTTKLVGIGGLSPCTKFQCKTKSIVLYRVDGIFHIWYSSYCSLHEQWGSILRFLTESVCSFIDFCPLVRLFQTSFLILSQDSSQGHSWALLCLWEGFVSGESCALVPPRHGTVGTPWVSTVPAAASHPPRCSQQKASVEGAFCQMHR